MSTRRFSFHRFSFDSRTLRDWLGARRPRSLPLRVALGMLGVAILLVLVVLGAVLGTLMLLGGMLMRLLGSRGKPQADGGRILEGRYRVIGKPMLPRGS
ncbi:MAG: hypothetical protein Q4F49_06650 [Pseudoxanthomonas suwonensis]|nr:hypothetical protein [Pseudoxanthomonas suwonensis]